MRLIKQAFTQDRHCCCPTDDQPILELELVDGGGGEYLVLRAEQFAIDSAEDVSALSEAILEMLKGAR